MDAIARRQALLHTLSVRRYETIDNLAAAFEVSKRTIRRDIFTLSTQVPIFTVSGRHGGGVYLTDNYYSERTYLSDTEIQLLQKILCTLQKEDSKFSTEDQEALKQLLHKRTKPNYLYQEEKT